MISSKIREETWEHMRDAERLVRYYIRLSDRYRKINDIIRGLFYFFAVSGITSFWQESFPVWAKITISAILAVAITADFIMEPGKKSILLHGIGIQCDQLNDQWKELWVGIEKG